MLIILGISIALWAESKFQDFELRKYERQKLSALKNNLESLIGRLQKSNEIELNRRDILLSLLELRHAGNLGGLSEETVVMGFRMHDFSLAGFLIVVRGPLPDQFIIFVYPS